MNPEFVATVHKTIGVGNHTPGTYINPEGVKPEIQNNVLALSPHPSHPLKKRKLQPAEEAVPCKSQLNISKLRAVGVAG